DARKRACIGTMNCPADVAQASSPGVLAGVLACEFTGRTARYVLGVAQIFNLPYRRFVIGSTLLAGDRWQVKNLRYSAARRSRNQTLPLLHRMEERAGERRGRPSPRSSPHSCVVGRGRRKARDKNRRSLR